MQVGRNVNVYYISMIINLYVLIYTHHTYIHTIDIVFQYINI